MFLGIDTNETNLDHARERWLQKNMPFAADFRQLDPAADRLDVVSDANHLFDIMTCQGAVERSFGSEETARLLLSNVATHLRPGGFFFGIFPDSSAIWYKAQKAFMNQKTQVRGEGYTIKFESETFTYFGTRCTIRYDDGVEYTEPLVHFPSLLRLAKEAGLQYIEAVNLVDFFEDNKRKFSHILTGERIVDRKGKLVRFEDVCGLFSTFVFQKMRTLGEDPTTKGEARVINPDGAPPILDQAEFQGNGYDPLSS
mmetsp:Transcript_11431/g.19410  ORF Transcript_11431/g.19410 Transcript_11431/m.19410 type:complete len:255 (+) Transcript_11431:257-1021(+)